MNSNRMNEVVARVVAWHNRHPLARRITAAQVNSIGVVALPFATTAERSGDPLRADLIAPRMMVEPSFSPPTLDTVVEPSQARPETADDTTETLSLPERAMTQASDPDTKTTSETSSAASADEPMPAESKPTRSRFDPRRLLGALRRLIWPGSRVGFQSLFNEDFIAPLSPKQVARWALLHGSTTRPGEADWPQREVPPSPLLLSKAFATSGVEPVTLYLTAAAIDTPRGRLRVLLGRNGLGQTSRVIGPRDLSRMRMALSGVFLFSILALLAWGYLQEPAAEDVKTPVPVVAEAASEAASASPALVIRSTSEPASAVTVKQQAAAVPASAAVQASQVTAAVPALQSASSARLEAVAHAPAVASAVAAGTPKTRASAASGVQQRVIRSTAALSSTAGSAVDIGLGMRDKSLIPEDVRQAAMIEGKRLRASAAQSAKPGASMPSAAASAATTPPTAAAADRATPAVKLTPIKEASDSKAVPRPDSAASAADAREGPRFYALVTKPSRSRAEALSRMALLNAAAANAIAPRGTRIELLQTQTTWQAVWWPFSKREDAERARHLLTVRGVLVEMVEF